MRCKRYTPQNEEVESLLFDQLFDIVKNEETADQLFGFFRTSEFIDMFGDYINGGENESIKERTDENGSPKLIFDNVLNKYYFIDKLNERVYYPHNQGLISILNIEDIMKLREIMALKYYETLEFDFNNKEFLNIEDSNITTIITDFLDYKTDELKNDPDFYISTMYGNSVDMSKKYIGEWVQEVKDYFEAKGLIIKKDQIEAQEEEEIETAENLPRTELIRKEAFLVNRKDTVNNNIKLFLSLLKGNTLNKFNEYDFIAFDDVYTTLNTVLANRIPIDDENGNLENVYELFLDQIKLHGEFKPYLADLYDKIRGIDNENFKFQFVNAFFLARKKFLGSDIIIDKGAYTYEIKDLSEVSSRKKGVLSNWNFLMNTGNITIVDMQELKNTMSPEIKLLDKTPTATSYSRVFDKLLFKLTMVGIPLPSEALNYHIQANYGQSLEDNIYGLQDVIGNINMAISSFDVKTDVATDLLNNSAFVKLAAAESFFLSEGSDASFFSAGKNKWLYSLYSHLEKTILEWRKDPSTLEDHINSSAFTKGSHYGQYFLAYDVAEEEREEVRKERINEIETFVFNSVQIKNQSIDAADNKSIFYVDSLADYINKMFNYLKPNGKSYHKTALAADKSTEYQISWGSNPGVFNIKSNATVKDGTLKITKQVQDIYYEYFKSEYYRITEVHNALDIGKDLVVHYHTGVANGKLSQLFPSLSPVFNDGTASNPKDVSVPLYDETGRPIYEDLDSIKEEIMPAIVDALKKNIQDTMKSLEEANLTYYTVSGFRKFQGIDETILNTYIGGARKFKKNLTTEEKTKRKAKIESGYFQLAADLTVNSIISQVEYSKLITGDVAYYKNILDYKKRVPATYTDGQYLTLLSDEEKYFNAAIIDKVEYGTPNMELLKARLPERIWKQYESVNAADAQAWITPKRWIFIMKRLGKWNDTMQSLSEKFYEETPQFTSKELQVLAQPLKGVYFSNKEGHPVYLKYSQAVLLPRLIKGTDLGTLYDKMVDADIDELITLDGIKVGATNVTVSHNADGTVKDDLTLIPMELSNLHWKMQQDLPTKGVKPRELGSQIQKNIFQGLGYNLTETFTIGDQEVTGAEAIVYINDLFGALSNKGTQKFLNQLGVDESFKITNEDGLFVNLLNQLKSRTSASKNIIDALQARTSPFGIPGSYSIFQNIFSSLSNKASIKIKTNGGGFIQMADYGLSKNEAIDQGIVFTPWFEKNEERLSPPVIGINPITGKEVIQPGGIFLSGSMIAKHIPNYASMPRNKLFGTLNKETGKYEGGKIDERILRNIIGYRIPNQALSSNDSLQVMGILPEEMGDTVIAYTGITEKTGSDFDIDKMYLMVPSFKAHYTSAKDNNPYRKVFNFMEDTEWSADKLRSEIFKIGEAPTGKKIDDQTIIAKAIMEDSSYEYFEPFRKYNKVKSARSLEYIEVDPELSLEEQSAEALQNKLIEAYKGVLTNPAVYAQLMNPIEVPHIKNDIKSLIPEKEQINLSDFSAIRDLQLKSSFRLGKTGLGQVINYLVDSVRGSMGELHFVESGFSWGNHNDQSESVLDRRYSEKLTKQEKKDYMASFNANRKGAPALTMEDMNSLEELELTESFMGLVNGFVDIAKDEYIVEGNWTTKTNGLGLSLLRAGAHPFKIDAFLKQPILKEYMKFSDTLNSKNIQSRGNIEHLFKLHKFQETFKNSEDIVTNDEVKNFYELTKKLVTYNSIQNIQFYNEARYQDSVDAAMVKIKTALYKEFGLDNSKEDDQVLDEVMETYTNTFQEYFNSPSLAFEDFSLKILRDQITEEEDNTTQIGVFEIFLDWQKKAREVGKIVAVNKVDTNGKGKNITSAVVLLNLADAVLKGGKEGQIAGYDSMLNFEGRPTIVNYSLINGLSTPFKIMQANPKFFPTATPGVVRTFNMIARLMGNTNLEDQFLGDKLERAYYGYLMGGFGPLNINNAQKIDLIKNLPDELLKMKEEHSENDLLKELQLIESATPKKFYISMSSNNKTTSRKNEITNGWLDLLEQEPVFAEKLIKYSYIESSFSKSITQFHEFIPYQWFNKNRLNSYLKGAHLNSYQVDFNFIDQFFRNNLELEDTSLKLTTNNSGYSKADPSGRYLRLGPKITPKNEKFIKYIAYKEAVTDELGSAFEEFSTSTLPTTQYFKFIGMDEHNRTIYARTSPLGLLDAKGNRFEEYNLGSIDNPYGLQSMFSANVSDYLYSQGVDLKTLENITNSESNYALPRKRFYTALDTLPIEVEDIASTSGQLETILTDLEINDAESLVMSEKSGILEPLSELQIQNINNLKKLIPSYEKYSNEEIQSYINSKIPKSKVQVVLFHSTSKKFTGAFKDADIGIYFADDSSGGFVGDNIKIPVVVNLENPITTPGSSYNLQNISELYPNNDGIIGIDTYEGITTIEEYVVKSPEQIIRLDSPAIIKEMEESTNNKEDGFDFC